MESKNKTKLQIELEKYIADINPMHLVIGTDREYEHEVEMFLERKNDSMNLEQLVEIIRQVFREMFNIVEDDTYFEDYKKISEKYIELKAKQ